MLFLTNSGLRLAWGASSTRICARRHPGWRTRPLVTLLSGLSELLDQVGIVLDEMLVIGDDADGVGALPSTP